MKRMKRYILLLIFLCSSSLAFADGSRELLTRSTSLAGVSDSCVGELYLTTEYLDLSVTVNRRKFTGEMR